MLDVPSSPSSPLKMPAPLEMERRDGGTLSQEEFIRVYAIPGRPVIIRDAFPKWAALGKWTPDFFRREHGHRTVVLEGRDMPLGEYIERVVAATPDNPVPYLRETMVRKLAPELGDDLMPFVDYALPNWLRGVYPDPEVDNHMNRAAEVELFIGGHGSILERRKAEFDPNYTGLHGESVPGFADLHYDPTACPVLLCQIYGRKQFTVYSPEDTPYLYAEGRHSHVPDMETPDLERYPLFAKARPYRFVQEPGEAVYVPAGWWHATKMLSVSIAVGSTFAHQAHWSGVIDEVMRDVVGGKTSLRARAIEAWMRADGRFKSLAGARLGESTHFRDPPARAAVKSAKKLVKSALGRG
jgi:histone arginine demethylase JMJD6